MSVTYTDCQTCCCAAIRDLDGASDFLQASAENGTGDCTCMVGTFANNMFNDGTPNCEWLATSSSPAHPCVLSGGVCTTLFRVTCDRLQLVLDCGGGSQTKEILASGGAIDCDPAPDFLFTGYSAAGTGCCNDVVSGTFDVRITL